MCLDLGVQIERLLKRVNILRLRWVHYMLSLCVFRSWCPDRTIAQARKYIASSMGKLYVVPLCVLDLGVQIERLLKLVNTLRLQWVNYMLSLCVF